MQNNVTEIRTDALKLLVMMKRPVPRAAATIGAWLNIFQVTRLLQTHFKILFSSLADMLVCPFCLLFSIGRELVKARESSLLTRCMCVLERGGGS